MLPNTWLATLIGPDRPKKSAGTDSGQTVEEDLQTALPLCLSIQGEPRFDYACLMALNCRRGMKTAICYNKIRLDSQRFYRIRNGHLRHDGLDDKLLLIPD